MPYVPPTRYNVDFRYAGQRAVHRWRSDHYIPLGSQDTAYIIATDIPSAALLPVLKAAALGDLPRNSNPIIKLAVEWAEAIGYSVLYDTVKDFDSVLSDFANSSTFAKNSTKSKRCAQVISAAQDMAALLDETAHTRRTHRKAADKYVLEFVDKTSETHPIAQAWQLSRDTNDDGPRQRLQDHLMSLLDHHKSMWKNNTDTDISIWYKDTPYTAVSWVDPYTQNIQPMLDSGYGIPWIGYAKSVSLAAKILLDAVDEDKNRYRPDDSIYSAMDTIQDLAYGNPRNYAIDSARDIILGPAAIVTATHEQAQVLSRADTDNDLMIMEYPVDDTELQDSWLGFTA